MERQWFDLEVEWKYIMVHRSIMESGGPATHWSYSKAVMLYMRFHVADDRDKDIREILGMN
jgi:hypothetical protein